jgi:hypothetical protein
MVNFLIKVPTNHSMVLHSYISYGSNFYSNRRQNHTNRGVGYGSDFYGDQRQKWTSSSKHSMYLHLHFQPSP